MSTQRYISTSFWDDSWIQTLDPSEKLLYLYYMTNPLTNIAGVYKITLRRICFDTGFNDSTIKHIQEKFEKAGKAFLIGEYIALPSWPNHQKWQKSKNIKDGIDAILASLPDFMIEKLESIGYKYPLHTPCIPPTKCSSYSDLDTDIDLDINTDSETPQPKQPKEKAAAQRVFEYYFEKYKKEHSDIPVDNTGKCVKIIKSRLETCTVDDIIASIDFNWTNEFVVKNGHAIGSILAANLISAFKANRPAVPKEPEFVKLPEEYLENYWKGENKCKE